jgi:hypothetical protein
MRFKTLLDFKNRLPFLNDFYATEGGDSVLSRLFEHRPNGLFVDVGARHPAMYSHTSHFYKIGWRGININPSPEAIRAFELLRPGDINLAISVSDKEEQLPFFVFNQPVQRSSGFDYLIAKDSKPQSQIKDIITVKTNTLTNILDWYLPQGQIISFLTVTAECDYYKILSSNNWNKYRPEVILLESESSYNGFNNSTLNRFMTQRGYELFAKKGNTCFLKDIRG